MSSADCLILPTNFDLSPTVISRFVAVATGAKLSRDKVIIFPCVLPDLPIWVTVDIWAFPIHSSVALPCEPYIRFLCVRTSSLLMASFRFAVTRNTLDNHYCFLSTRHIQGLTPCQTITMPDILKEANPNQRISFFYSSVKITYVLLLQIVSLSLTHL